jgi:hypothetical protein
MNIFAKNIRKYFNKNRKPIIDLFIAAGIGIVCGLICLFALIQRNYSASDFQFPLEAARALLLKTNPYTAVIPRGNYPFDQYFYYPIIAAFFSIPFTWLPDQLAGAAFIGVTSGLLAYVLARKDRWRLGLFLSAPAFVTIYTAQWSFLIAAFLLIPQFQFLLLCKPNIGMAAFLYQPTIKGIISILLGIGISLIFFPTWVMDWLRTLSYTARFHIPPVFSLLILFSVFCLIKFKLPEGRLLMALLIVPQALFFYDQLLLWFVPKTSIELWGFNLLSWIGYIIWRIQLKGLPDTGQFVPTAKPFVLWFIYFPAIIILLLPDIHNLLITLLGKIKKRMGDPLQ